MGQHRHNLISLLLVAIVLVGSWVASDRGRLATPESVVQSPESEVVNQQTALVLDSINPVTLPPSVSAVAALVKDLSNGAELFTSAPEKQWSLASLVKLMTAVVAIENLADDQLLTVSRSAVATEGAAGFLVAGKKYSLAELLRSMLVFSSNDAAVVVAENYGKDQFIVKMNSKAVELGMKNTRFFDPSGLSALNQSTAEDLALLMRYIFRDRPQILAITREAIDGATHPFAGQPDFMGGKTGFIDEAGGNLISLFNYQGRPMLIIILGSSQREADTKILHEWFLN